MAKTKTELDNIYKDVEAVQAWTSKKFYVTAGLAFVGTMCDGGLASGVCNMIYPFGNGNSGIWTHELGHNLGLQHTNGGGIMDYKGKNTFFDSVSKNELNTFLNTEYGVETPRCLEYDLLNPNATHSPTISSQQSPTASSSKKLFQEYTFQIVGILCFILIQS